jgi:hypothetical protein
MPANHTEPLNIKQLHVVAVKVYTDVAAKRNAHTLTRCKLATAVVTAGIGHAAIIERYDA